VARDFSLGTGQTCAASISIYGLPERLPERSRSITIHNEVILESKMAVHVTTKGQVTIPKRVRDLLKIQPGSAVDFLIEPGGRVTLRKVGRQVKIKSRFAALRGRATIRMGTEQIMALTRGED
jgi:AbrB family looped-hinge helix DNA binding protein